MGILSGVAVLNLVDGGALACSPPRHVMGTFFEAPRVPSDNTPRCQEVSPFAAKGGPTQVRAPGQVRR
jgi:hypothetical protein